MMASAAVVVAAWLLTYLLHSSLLLGSVWLASRTLGARVEPYAETGWRLAMVGSVATSLLQTMLLATHPSLVMSGAADIISEPMVRGALDPSASVGGTSGIPIVIALVIGWLAIAVVLVAAFVRALRITARGIERAPCGERMQRRATTIAGETRVFVSVAAGIATPVVIGAREVCLPTRVTDELSEEEVGAVLAHEIAHVIRRDPHWLVLTGVVTRMMFFQPLNRLAVAELRSLAELSCDAWALRRTGNRLALASALVRASQWLVGAPANRLAIAMASKESLALQRVRRILDSRDDHSAVHRPQFTAALTLLLAAAVVLAPGISGRNAIPSPYTIQARDDAGPFTVTLDRGVVTGFTFDGLPITPLQLSQAGRTIRVIDPHGIRLELTLTDRGGIQWQSRALAQR